MSSHITGTGIPFVVIVGNERIYFGTFWSSYSSIVLPQCAFIDVSFNTCRIQLAKGAIDKRSDTRIYKSLKQSGVLIE
jgi:hypothetical protein